MTMFNEFLSAAVQMRTRADRRKARAEVDKMIARGALQYVDRDWDSISTAAREALEASLTPRGIRRDVLALFYHREQIEAVRMAVCRAFDIDTWPNGDQLRVVQDRMAHAEKLRAEIDVVARFHDKRVADTSWGDRGPLLCRVSSGRWTPAEMEFVPTLSASSAHWSGWWLDWFREHERKISAG